MRKLTMIKPWQMRLLIGMLAIGVAWSIEFGLAPAFFAVGNEMVRDAFVRMQLDIRDETRITIVDIDETSLAAHSWPWSRARLANLVEVLIGPLGARAVALDMVLPDASNAPDDDRLLGALATHSPITIAIAFDFVNRREAIQQGYISNGRTQEIPAAALTATGFVGNYKELSSARCAGNIGFISDLDGSVRRLPAVVRFQEYQYPTLAVALAECIDLLNPSRGPWANTLSKTSLWRIPFRIPFENYTVVPAKLVLSNGVDMSLFKGRLVIIGSSALGLSDRVASPLNPNTPGMMIHAAALTNILDVAEGRSADALPMHYISLGWSALTTLLSLLLIARVGPGKSITAVFLLGIIWLCIAYAGVKSNAEFSILAPAGALTVIMIIALPIQWWLARRELFSMKQLLAHYVAPEVLEEIFRQGTENPLVPQHRTITVLSADMEGYTPLTSALSLDDAALLTRNFLDLLTIPVLAQSGTLDKYTGDGLVAFWGAPLDCAEQTEKAVLAAKQIINAIQLYNDSAKAVGKAVIRVRIGIERGNALVGDLGTPFRSTYTAVGDCINFAAKLQDLARNQPTDIIIGPTAASHMGNYGVRSLGMQSMRGANQPVEVFAPL